MKNNIIVRSYKIEKKGLSQKGKFSAVFLTDLHIGENTKHIHEIEKKLEQLCPDVVLVGGDVIIGRKGEHIQNAIAFMKRISEKYRVIYANGNHEQRMKELPENYKASYQEYKKELKNVGVTFLENSAAILEWSGKKVKISGLEIPLACYLHFHHGELKIQEIIDRIGEREEDCYEVILAHNPSYMKQYLERGADLILSGHLHGGIVRIPGVVGAISPSFEIFPKYSGDHYRESNTDIIVSKGLGTHTVNIRLFNPAELVVLNFSGN